MSRRVGYSTAPRKKRKKKPVVQDLPLFKDLTPCISLKSKLIIFYFYRKSCILTPFSNDILSIIMNYAVSFFFLSFTKFYNEFWSTE